MLCFLNDFVWSIASKKYFPLARKFIVCVPFFVQFMHWGLQTSHGVQGPQVATGVAVYILTRRYTVTRVITGLLGGTVLAVRRVCQCVPRYGVGSVGLTPNGGRGL